MQLSDSPAGETPGHFTLLLIVPYRSCISDEIKERKKEKF